MSIYPDWIGVSVDGGGAVIIDGIELELVDDQLDITLDDRALELVIENNDLQLEVC